MISYGVPGRYDTTVGGAGRLSPGPETAHRHRQGLAGEPNILILDDSTSSVDFVTERQIQNARDDLMRGRTSS